MSEKIKSRQTKEEPVSECRKPTTQEIENAKAELRKIIETSGSIVAVRMAQCEEHALRWVTEETEDWQTPPDDAVSMSEMLRRDLEVPND